MPSIYPTPTAPPAVSSLTWVNQGTATAADTTTDCGFTFECTGQVGNDRHLLVQSVPAGSWTIELGLFHALSNFAVPVVGVCAYRGAASKVVHLIEYQSGSNLGFDVSSISPLNAGSGTALASFNLNDGLYPGTRPGWSPLYLRIGYDAGTDTLTFAWAPEGTQWRTLYTSTATAILGGAPDKIGLVFDLPGNSTTSGDKVLGRVFHWKVS